MKQRKKLMRNAVLKERRVLADDWISVKSKLILNKIISLAQYGDAKTVMCYAAMKDEVQTNDLIKIMLNEQKRVCIPHIEKAAGIMDAALVSDEKELVAGKYGILSVPEDSLQRVDPAEIDLVILPGAAFGRRGERLGLGAGYYDRFLPRATKAVLTGVAFSYQIKEDIPMMAHDCLVDYVITEEEIIDCKTGKM